MPNRIQLSRWPMPEIREPIRTRHRSVYGETVARENESFRAGVEHAIAVLAQFDEPAADRLEAMLFVDPAEAGQ